MSKSSKTLPPIDASVYPDFYPGKMLIIKFLDGYRLVVTFKYYEIPEQGVELVELFDSAGVVAAYQTERLDFRGNVDFRGRVEELSGGMTQPAFAARWQAAEEYLVQIGHPAAGKISHKGQKDLVRNQAPLIMRGASDYAWEHANRVVVDVNAENEKQYGHRLISFNDFGDDWWCIGCFQTGTPYDGDRPKDKPCVPRPKPADWPY